MYQESITRQIRIAASLAVAALALGATVAGAQDVPGCQTAIVKGAQKYASTRMKALQKCEEARLTGKILTACDADTKTQDKIGKAATKLQDGITKACGGVTVADLGFDNLVSRCVGGSRDGEYCTSNGQCYDGGACGTATICPAFLNDSLGATCAIALATPDDVGTCVTCASARKIDAVVASFYGTLLPASADKAVLKCQKDIGKRTAKFFDAVEKALAKCEQAVIKAGAGSCPDAKANDAIAKATTKLDAAIAKTCVDAAAIGAGARPTQIWGEATRFGACPATSTQSAPGLAGALGCLAQNAAACDVGLTVGNPACSTNPCGNGQIDAGETCDDGNTVRDGGVGADDICPEDCAVAACAVSGTQSVTINLSVPTNVVSALVLVSYNDGDVSLPGVGDAPTVQGRVTSGVFATSPRDSETALRINLEDPSVTGIGSGAAATVTFDVCSAATVTASDFSCMVVSAGDTAFNEVFGATCSVSVP